MVQRVTLHNEDDLSVLLSGLTDPILVENVLDFISFPGIESYLTSIETLGRIDASEDDCVGYVSLDGSVTGMSLSSAVAQLANVGGYINGWEYAAGDVSSRVINTDAIDSILTPLSFLPSCLGPGGVALDLVMRWVFISRGPSMGSDWHVDPIGSAAWMLQVTGNKQWDFRFCDQEQTIELRSGELILVPPGWEHRVRNLGQELNVAVSHNWVPISDQGKMWMEVARALNHLKSSTNILTALEYMQEKELIDNLLMGLLMVLCRSDPALAVVPKDLQVQLLGIRDRLRAETEDIN